MLLMLISNFNSVQYNIKKDPIDVCLRYILAHSNLKVHFKKRKYFFNIYLLKGYSISQKPFFTIATYKLNDLNLKCCKV